MPYERFTDRARRVTVLANEEAGQKPGNRFIIDSNCGQKWEDGKHNLTIFTKGATV